MRTKFLFFGHLCAFYSSCKGYRKKFCFLKYAQGVLLAPAAGLQGICCMFLGSSVCIVLFLFVIFLVVGKV